MSEWTDDYDIWDEKVETWKKRLGMILFLVNVIMGIGCLSLGWGGFLIILFFSANAFMIGTYLKRFYLKKSKNTYPTTKRKWKFWKKDKDED